MSTQILLKASSREEKRNSTNIVTIPTEMTVLSEGFVACQDTTCLNQPILPIIILMVPLFPISSLSSSDTARLRSAPMACSTVLRSGH